AGDVLAHVLVQALAGELLHDQAQRDQPQVGVHVRGAGRRGGGDREHGVETGGDVRVGGVEVDERREPADVGEQVADGDLALPVLGEAGQVHGDAIVEPQPALLDELHHGGGGEDLRDRGEVVDRVGARRDP